MSSWYEDLIDGVALQNRVDAEASGLPELLKSGLRKLWIVIRPSLRQAALDFLASLMKDDGKDGAV